MTTVLQLAKSKTIWFALALAILGVIEIQAKLFAPYMSPEAFGIFNITLGIIVAVLRVLTTMPLSEK